MTILDVSTMPGICELCLLPEPAAHAAGMAHPRPIPGCPWCVPVCCPCGGRCADPGECHRLWRGAETTWREQAALTAFTSGSALYGRRSR